MDTVENNLNEWMEIRARVDSIAHAVFLIAGGALSLSITIVLGNLQKFRLSLSDVYALEWAWALLVLSIVLALTLKVEMVLQKYLLLVQASFMNRHFMTFNRMGWVIGCVAFLAFCGGIIFLALAASGILNSHV